MDAATIRSHPDVAEPAGGSAEWIEAAGGHRQRAAFYPATKPIGTVVISAGRTEFIEKYFEVIGELLDRGYSVLIHDWRGQGLSKRLLRCVVEHEDLQGLRRFLLLPSDAHGLYRQFGFEALGNPSRFMEVLRQDIYRAP